MGHYLFNLAVGDAAPGTGLHEQGKRFLRAKMWGVNADEPHRNALSAGDLILVYLGAQANEPTPAADGSLARDTAD